MAGETSVIHVPFAGGLDEKIAKEYLDASARQAAIVNGDFVKVGAIDKRAGLKHLPNALIAGSTVLPALTSGTRIVGWSRSSLSILCSTGLYQHVTAPVGGTTAGGVVGVASLPNVACLRRHITTGDQYAPPTLVDCVYSGQLLRIAIFWDSSFNLLASVYDVASGNVILEPVLIYANTGSVDAGTIPRVVSAFDLPGIANGNPRPVIVIQDQKTTRVDYIQYNPAANAFTAPTTLVATCTIVDVSPYEDDPANGWLVAYDVAGTPPKIRTAYWRPGGLQTSVDQSLAAGESLGVSCYVVGRYGQSVFVFWSANTATTMRLWAQRRDANYAFASGTGGLNGNGTTNYASAPYTTGAFFPVSGAALLGTNKAFVTYWGRGTPDSSGNGPSPFRLNWTVIIDFAGSPTTLASGRGGFGLYPATRPFVVNGEVYQPLYYNLDYVISSTEASKSQQLTLYLCKYQGVGDNMPAGTVSTDVCRPVTTVAPRIAANAGQGILDLFGGFHTGMPSTVSRTATRVAVGLKTRGDTATMAGPSWAVDFFWDQASTQSLYQTSEIGAELSISGAVPFVADGQSAFEDGFFNYPELTYVKGVAPDPPTSTMPPGQYSFAVVYRSVDSSGLTHRSAPFITAPFTVSTGSGAPVLYITPPIPSYRDVLATSTTVGKVFADIYMTRTTGGSLYYKDSIVVSNTGQAAAPTSIRYPATGQIGAMPPATNPLLYTTGGALDNVNPPASLIQIAHQDRKALVDETLRNVWFSKAFTPGEAPGFNESLVVPFPDGGDITALGSMDGKFVVFKARSVWVMEGDGPSDAGTNSTWSTPQAIATDVGAKAWQSVVLTPRGLMFQAPNNGIYLLGRDLQVDFIGKSVIDQTSDFPVIVSVTLAPSSTQVRFACQNTAGTDQILVVYDYLLGQWTTHEYGQLSAPVASTCLTFGSQQFTVLTTDGHLWQERTPTDPNRCMDQDVTGRNCFVPTTITVPFIKTQVQGYQRMRRIQTFCEQQDDCGLLVNLAFNYDETIRQTATWTSQQLQPLNIRGLVETYVSAAYNKQMSVQVSISDTPGAAMTTGAGMRFAAMALELQNLGPRYKLSGAAARR
ncbi:hypothetical protein AKJ09_00037 [Labilithrix luteola]|uniref:Uncharacterized protein n=1 Tax=Labilithrix luteola TaxID=1391654 RepID=A0A0K1PIJ6_9BACT|nr:hypothetical protein [Labilithrix luteola]AKU93373.1 hypothetical protein AKJ09_00037 [Labilithrix luteola]